MRYNLIALNHKALLKEECQMGAKAHKRYTYLLRHTYITRMFEAGLVIKEIQYLAGHSTVDMTLRVYTHYDQKSRRTKTAEKVREALRT